MKKRIFNLMMLLLYLSSGLIAREAFGVNMSIEAAILIPILVPILFFLIGVGMFFLWVFGLLIIEIISDQI